MNRNRTDSAVNQAQEAALETVVTTSSWAMDHVRQVRRLAISIFESLREYHGLGKSELILLEAGALLHDVGYPTDPDNHHKVSARIIRSLLGPPFTPDQVLLIALLARYHRKGLPHLGQKRYAALDERGRRLIHWLGGILRVADGLDRAHDSAVIWIATSVVDGRLEIRVSDQANPVRGGLATNAIDPERLAPHVDAATKKSELLGRAIGRPVVIRAV
ncbi:MAG TPA: HD domain-containing protein [Chloroflexota bacterium]|nr:HD domain-containing protein [Chloroflexota bacterium]